MVLLDPNATSAFGAKIGAVLQIGDVITLTGTLGAGKTVIAGGILAGAGLQSEAPSPSFPIVISYDPPVVRLPVAHVDLYRIDDVADLDELGLDDARSDGALVIEWPDRLGHRAWVDALALSLDVRDDGARVLTAQVPAAWENRWPPR
ncbi:MAG: tRNA (adenosine(37)-N6)-threonylcarbamoyltransferase complex ATPase subunit type 1 TsaE [Sphingomonadales bacterium]